MKDRGEVRPSSVEQQQAAAQALVDSGFPTVVSELTQSFPNLQLESATWDEKGNSTIEGIKGKPNSAGLVVRWGLIEYPEVETDYHKSEERGFERGETQLLGTRVRFKALIVETHSDGSIDVKGSGTMGSRNHDWSNQDAQRRAVQKGLEHPAYVSYVKPIPEEKKADLVPFDPHAGMNVSDAIDQMIDIADSTGKTVIAGFNEVGLTVRPGDNLNDTLSFFWEELRHQREEYDQSPSRVSAERESQRSEAREAAKHRQVEKRLSNAPGIEVSDEEAWQRYRDANKDPYGGAVISYAERWARLMQLDMAEGIPLEEIADKESHEANFEGITGLMYGAAVSTLAQTWKHGDQLRQWHNLKTQIRDEGERANESGGVLNPALLSLGLAES